MYADDSVIISSNKSSPKGRAHSGVETLTQKKYRTQSYLTERDAIKLDT